MIRLLTTLGLGVSVGVVNGLNNGVGENPPLGWNPWKTCGDEVMVLTGKYDGFK
jgi:hypothetical protein